MEQLLGPRVGHAELHPHCLDGVVEDLLHAGHTEALVRKILWVVIIVELARPALVVKIVEAEVVFVYELAFVFVLIFVFVCVRPVVVLVAAAIVLITFVLVPAVVRQGGRALPLHNTF